MDRIDPLIRCLDDLKRSQRVRRFYKVVRVAIRVGRLVWPIVKPMWRRFKEQYSICDACGERETCADADRPLCVKLEEEGKRGSLG